MASDKVNYPEASAIAQAIKYQIRIGGFWESLPGYAKESLDQIATAMARTVAGDGVHWDGISALAQAAKPTTNATAPRAAAAGVEAIERSLRDIPNRDHAT